MRATGTLLARLDELASRRGPACETYGITWLESDIDVGAIKLYLTGGAPVELGRRRGGDGARAARRDRRLPRPRRSAPASTAATSSRATSANPHRRTYAVMGDAVNLAARLTARAKPGEILATADVLDRARTIYATETRAAPREGQGAGRHGARGRRARIGQRPKQQPDLTPIVGREAELERLQQAVNARAHAAAAGGRARRRARASASRGSCRSCGRCALGFQQLDGAARARTRRAEPFAAIRAPLRQLVGITPDRSAAEAGDDAAAVRRAG